jgi:hypothetical protein
LKPIVRIGIIGGCDRKSSVNIGNGVISAIPNLPEGREAMVQGDDNQNRLTC